MRTTACLCIVLLGAAACDQTAQVGDAAKAAAKSAEDAAKRTSAAVDDANKAIDSAKQKAGDASKSAGDLIDDAKAATSRAWAGMTDTGELSKTALAWMADDAREDDIRKVLTKGGQVAPVALEIAKTVNAAVDSETAVEPIYQPLDGRDPDEVDKAISSMARVEVIDGLKVGFEQLHQTSTAVSVDESAYLITWRQGDHVIGFVYRSKRTIDIDKLIEETPRLVTMTKAAIAEP
ncbi:MAG: hypothetical protein IAG13_17545 [Deltaproteobacteria bacterium]|nr:hypothetical protein [Nannocystaceae bacterium]